MLANFTSSSGSGGKKQALKEHEPLDRRRRPDVVPHRALSRNKPPASSATVRTPARQSQIWARGGRARRNGPQARQTGIRRDRASGAARPGLGLNIRCLFCRAPNAAPDPEVLRSLFLSSGGRFFCFRTGFRPDFCREGPKLAPPAGLRPAGGAIFAPPLQKSGQNPVRKRKNRPPELK